MRPPLIESLTVENFRALRNLNVKKLRPLTVLIGPNGSGKSTFFDVFAFLSECFTDSVRSAAARRNGLRDIRSRGSHGRVTIELSYRERPQSRLLTYRLELDEVAGRPVIARELLRWRVNPGSGRPTNILDFQLGEGAVYDEETGAREQQSLTSADVLAVNALGQFKEHPRVAALRSFIQGWYLSYLSADAGRGVSESGPQERLTRSGDNLNNVLQFLNEQHRGRLDQILEALRTSIPRLQSVDYEQTRDGRLVLWLRDSPFDEPVLARNASDGTLKMLAYLTLLQDPNPAPFIGIEEPENHLYRSLLPGLAGNCRTASGRSQIIVTTHSHEFVNACQANEVLVIYRDDSGYAKAIRPLDVPLVPEMLESGGKLGWLWQEGYLEALPEPYTPVSEVAV